VITENKRNYMTIISHGRYTDKRTGEYVVLINIGEDVFTFRTDSGITYTTDYATFCAHFTLGEA